MRETVRTKYVGPTGLRGSKIVVFWKGRGQKTVSFDYAAFNVDESAVFTAAKHFGVEIVSITVSAPAPGGYRYDLTT